MNAIHESYLVPFFQEMNTTFPGNWCVLHSYETLPFYSESDVDMAFSGNDLTLLESVIKKVANKNGWRIYQRLWYDVQYCYYYVLQHVAEETFLAIDFLIDNDGIGKYGFKTNILTTDCLMVKNLFPIPNPEVAFCYKLTKRIVKQRSLEEDRSYLVEQYKASNPANISAFLTGQYGSKGNGLIERYLTQDNFSPTANDIRFLKEQRAKQGHYLKYCFWETKRILDRILSPSGMIINVPDLANEDLKLFCELLEKKVDILFRFVRLNKTNSAKVRIKGLVGSTLVICPKKRFDHKKALRFHWIPLNTLGVNKINPQSPDTIEAIVDQYFVAILKALSIQIEKKNLAYEA